MNITIYSTTTCSYCHALTSWLESKGLAYKKHVVDEDPAAMAEFMSVSNGAIGVPFTVIKADDGTETKISGYDQNKFKQVLGL